MEITIFTLTLMTKGRVKGDCHVFFLHVNSFLSIYQTEIFLCKIRAFLEKQNKLVDMYVFETSIKQKEKSVIQF